MSAMVEHVAKALWDSAEVHSWNLTDESTKALYRHAACAAIRAMREPSREMIADGFVFSDSKTIEVWQAMIGAALEPKPCTR